jgi:hypothetical protein
MNGHETFDAQGQLLYDSTTMGQITLTEGKIKIVDIKRTRTCKRGGG